MKTQQLHQVLNCVWAVVADANRYFASEAPWALAKTDPKRQGTVLYVTAEVLRQVAILAQPFVPASAAKLLDLLAIPAQTNASFAALGPTGAHQGRRDAAGAGAGVSRATSKPEAKRPDTCWSTAIATSIFPILPPNSTPWWRARARPASAAW